MNIVHNCDCLEFMRDLPDNAFDLAIVDPPYGIIGESGKSNPTSRNRKHGQTYTVNELKPSAKYFSELFRISLNQIIWGGNYFSLPPSRGFIFWYKHQPVKTYADGEYAWTSYNINCKCFDYPYFGGGAGYEGKKIHPTQKPVALYKWLLKNYAKPGQTIFDSHVGSGSIRIACFELGFDFTGCELDHDYWQAQEDRFARHTSQQRLFMGGGK